MLSRRERETLAAIELGLAEEAPQLAAQFQRFGRGDPQLGHERGRRLLFVMMLFFAGLTLVCLLAGLVLGGVASGVLAASIGLGMLYFKKRAGHRRPW
ncbi:DUF3040 family protein [Halopolyspora algeriensis]|uniref:DUF3040 family protein n=1 Tax=Halopolyspora algeriensis TaxID=1500506 RepID=A0A368VS80_9ACTN|nr:DUF3040 domain-containing protein [Halopolyspora algeriensis]RCW44601.1 DUF3040 family protein [Halopolyspora algeriensis]TQM55962.1 DUF3040 family protein [Halopolyspora algeriensis]